MRHFGRAPITSHFVRLLARPPNLPFFGCDMRKGLQTLSFSFEAESLTHFGGLFLIQRFCNRLCLRRRLERIVKDTPNWVDLSVSTVIDGTMREAIEAIASGLVCAEG